MTDKKQEQILDIGGTYSKLEHWINENKTMLTIVVAGLFLVVGGYIGFNKFYLEPKEDEAQNQMFVAQKYFEKDSLNLALNGDKNYPGFIKIMEDYKWTKAANLSHYYAGVISLKIGKFDDAIMYLESFNGKDILVSGMALNCLGDAYSEKGDMDKAIDNYLKAAYNHENELTTPIFLKKAGMLLEKTGKKEKAVKMYQEINDKYPKSTEARDIEKYIARAQG